MWISKKKYEELVGRIDVLEKRISKFGSNGPEKLDKCRDDINNIQRIMDNSKFGEIMHISNWGSLLFEYETGNTINNHYTYIYKDFKEYKINGLYLYKPIFTVDENNNDLIHVKDTCYVYDGEKKKETDIEFLIDLQNQTFIRTK